MDSISSFKAAILALVFASPSIVGVPLFTSAIVPESLDAPGLLSPLRPLHSHPLALVSRPINSRGKFHALKGRAIVPCAEAEFGLWIPWQNKVWVTFPQPDTLPESESERVDPPPPWGSSRIIELAGNSP